MPHSLPTINGTPDRFPHESNDCSVRALANCLQIPYATAHKMLAKHTNRQTGRGPDLVSLHKLLKGLGFSCTALGTTYTARHLKLKDCTVKHLPKGATLGSIVPTIRGNAYLIVRGHALAVRDGVAYDMGYEISARLPVAAIYK